MYVNVHVYVCRFDWICVCVFAVIYVSVLHICSLLPQPLDAIMKIFIANHNFTFFEVRNHVTTPSHSRDLMLWRLSPSVHPLPVLCIPADFLPPPVCDVTGGGGESVQEPSLGQTSEVDLNVYWDVSVYIWLCCLCVLHCVLFSVLCTVFCVCCVFVVYCVLCLLCVCCVCCVCCVHGSRWVVQCLVQFS